MRKVSVHPDNGEGAGLDLSSVGGGQGVMPGAVQKPSRPKERFRIKDLKREDMAIAILIILSAAVAAFIVFT
jgi:hypothetical protein